MVKFITSDTEAGPVIMKLRGSKIAQQGRKIIMIKKENQMWCVDYELILLIK